MRKGLTWDCKEEGKKREIHGVMGRYEQCL